MVRKRILVVDDNRDTVTTTVELLRERGYESEGCFSGGEALERVRDYDPDVVVLDLAMPGVSGWQVAQTIREANPAGRPVLIAVTGEFKGAADMLLSKMSGFDH